MKKIAKIVAGSVWALPLLAFAQVNTGYVDSLLAAAKGIIDKLVVLLVALAVVWFIWNVVRYTMTADDEEKKAAARSQMIWGIVAIAVIVSIWGLVGILQNMFGAGGRSATNIGGLVPQN